MNEILGDKTLSNFGGLNDFAAYIRRVAEQRKEHETEKENLDYTADLATDVKEDKDDKLGEMDIVDATRRSNSNYYRRFLEYFKNAFKGRSNTFAPEITEKNPTVTAPQVQDPIAEILTNLSGTLTKLNEYLEKESKDNLFMVLKLPRTVNVNSLRVKRDLFENTIRNQTTVINTTITPTENETLLNKTDVKNSSKKATPADVQCNFNETRRDIIFASESNDTLEVKQKLLTYIEENFQELKEQIKKLQEMKQIYEGDSGFRVGYIIANVDVLQDNIKKLKEVTDENNNLWTERQLIEVFDKLKASNKVMVGLMQNVKNIYGGIGDRKKGGRKMLQPPAYEDLMQKDVI